MPITSPPPGTKSFALIVEDPDTPNGAFIHWVGAHHSFFKLYALDARLNLPEGVTKQELLKAMKGHVLGETELVGKYSRSETRKPEKKNNKEKKEQMIDEASEDSFPASDAPSWHP